MSVDGNGGEITPGGRFGRIEATLDRIEGKLDGKVGHEEFSPLIRRVELLESGETPLGKVLLGQFEHMQTQLGDLLLHGSANAQEAGRRVGALETKTAELERTQEAQETLADDRRDRDTHLFRQRSVYVSIVSAVALGLSVYEAFVRARGH
jgi:hypothetical protein